MPKPARPLALLACVPLLTGCFGLVATPVPSLPSQREALEVQGVIHRDGAREEFTEVHQVDWTNDQLFMVGIQEVDGTPQNVTRQYPLAGVESLLVHRLDAGRTSGLIAGVLVGSIVTITLLITGSGPG